MTTVTGGLAAFFVGLGLAGATAFGVVQSQQSAASSPVETTTVNYGTNG